MKPPIQSIIDKQRLAQQHLNSKTTRSEPEIAHYHRVLAPVPLIDLALNKLPMVQRDDQKFILLGEIAQMPGVVLLLDMMTGTIQQSDLDGLHLTPPS